MYVCCVYGSFLSGDRFIVMDWGEGGTGGANRVAFGDICVPFRYSDVHPVPPVWTIKILTSCA